MQGLTKRDRFRSPTDGRWVERAAVRYRAGTSEDAQRRHAADAAIYEGTGWALHRLA